MVFLAVLAAWAWGIIIVVFGFFFWPCFIVWLCQPLCQDDTSSLVELPLIEKDKSKTVKGRLLKVILLEPLNSGAKKIEPSKKFKPIPTNIPERRNSESELRNYENEYRKHFPQYDETMLSKLREKGKDIHFEDREKAYKHTLRLLLESMMAYKRTLLIPSEDNQVIHDREQYAIYGLVLNASIKRQQIGYGSPELVKEQVKRQYQFLQKHNDSSIDTSVRKALSVTWSMLTLLPPLLVTTDPQYYSEEIHDTNRHTWDEDKREPLYYYRPVLVYGNTLHVAVKGLVGNKDSSDIQLIDI